MNPETKRRDFFVSENGEEPCLAYTDRDHALDDLSPSAYAKLIHVVEQLPGDCPPMSRAELRKIFERANLHVPYNQEFWKISLKFLEEELFGKGE